MWNWFGRNIFTAFVRIQKCGIMKNVKLRHTKCSSKKKNERELRTAHENIRCPRHSVLISFSYTNTHAHVQRRILGYTYTY